MDGDTVVVKPVSSSQGARRSGRIVAVLQRAAQALVGVYTTDGGLGIVTPIDPRVPYDVFCNAADNPMARGGDVVSIRITTYPTRRTACSGVIEEVLGRQTDEGIETEVLIRRHSLETDFSAGTREQAAAASLDVEAARSEEWRRDVTDRLIVTIDPIDARDFDDAVSVEQLEEGRLRLGVHIADVSQYIAFGTSADLDARRRGTSVYLADRVIPMLPERFSCDLCSLNPDVERLAITVDMILNPDATVAEVELYPSIIRSRARLDYDMVEEYLEGRGHLPTPDIEELATRLAKIADRRFQMREQRGGIDFDTTETKVILDQNGKVEDIVLRRRTRATGAIEEAMVLANEQVALYLEQRLAHMVFRVHGAPSKDALIALIPLLTELDYPTEGLLRLDPHALQRVLAIAKNRPEKDLINMRVLRSMKQAVYSTVNIGHYGLALDSYCHFTSPIRRYPDLIVHRLLKAALAGCFDATGEYSGALARKSDSATSPALVGLKDMYGQLDWLARHCSEMERVAQDAAYESIQMKLCEYMEAFIGQTFSGIVTSVSSAGLFVTLPNTVKGLVPIQTLGSEYFEYDADYARLIGSETETTYHIGQRLDVVLVAVSVRDMTIDYRLADGRSRTGDM